MTSAGQMGGKKNLNILLDPHLTTKTVQLVETEPWDLIAAEIKWTGEGMNVIKVADTFMLGNGSPGPSYSLMSSPHSMEYILIPRCTMT